MARKLDARQTITRDYLDQLTLSSSWGPAIANEKPTFSTELDNLLRSLNSETTDPVRLRANYPNNLEVILDASVIVNPETLKNRLLSPTDSTIGKDMDDVFAGGTIAFGATLGSIVTVSGAGTGLPDLSALSLAAAGHGSVGVFIDSAGNIVLSASQVGTLLANPLPFPVVKPGLALVGMIEVEFDSSDNIVFFDDSKLFQFTNPDSNTLRDVVAQDRNTMLIGGGTWAWDHGGRNEIQRFTFGSTGVASPPEADELFRASYNDGVFTADVSGGALTATVVGTPVLTANKLDTNGQTGFVHYESIGSYTPKQGAIRLKATPNYSGAAVGSQLIFDITNNAGSLGQERTRLTHAPSNISVLFTSADGLKDHQANFGNWLPVAGTEYEIELNYDFATSAAELYIDGILFAAAVIGGGLVSADRSPIPDASVRIGVGNGIKTGSTVAFDGIIDDFQTFSLPQHIATNFPGDVPRVVDGSAAPVPAVPDAGSFTIDLGGDTTAAIPFTATAADVEAAIETGIAAITDVKVDGSFNSDLVVEFVGVNSNTPYAQMTTVSSLTNSGITVPIADSTDQEGSAIGVGNLTFDEDAVIHVPGVEVQQNTISFAASSPIVLQDDEVAYVDLNRDLEATGLVNLPITVASIDSDSILGNDVFVIARRYNGDALIADTFKLENQESQSLEASASDQTLQYIGAFNEADALPDYSSTNIVAQNDDLTTAIGKLDAEAGVVAGQVNQDRNIKMIGGGTWLWDLATTTLSWSSDAQIQVPGFDDDRNRILAGTAVLAANEAAYIELNRASDLPTTQSVTVSNISVVPTTDNIVIIARRDDNDIIVGTHSFRLGDKQSLELDGALQEIRRLNDQLKVVVSTTAVNEVDILPADITQLDLINGTQSTLVQEIGGAVLNFGGGTVNFTTGVISGGPAGTNFTPAVIPVGEYHWYSLSLDALALDATNRSTAVVRVGVGSASNALQASALYADFDGTRPLGQVQVQNIGGTITVVDIRRLGGGSGSGGWRTKVITAAYSADAGEELLVDTTGSAYTITLPDSPRDGSRVRIKDREQTFATNNLTLVTIDGSTIDGDPSPYVFDKEGAWAECVFDANDDEWKLFLSLPGSFTVVPVASAYTAKDLEDVVADTSGGAFAVTLPTSPSDGVRVRVKDAEGTFYNNAVSVTTVGPFTVNGAASPFVMSTDNTWAEFVYVAASGDWEVYSPLVGNVDWRVRALTATATAVDHDELMCDTSGGSFTINLPASPAEGTRVRFKDTTANFAMFPLSIATTDGASIEGFASPFEFDVERTWAELVYVSASNDWQILSPLVGDIDWRTATLTANYTAVNDDELMCNTTGGAFTVTLPDGATITDGTRVRVKDYGDSFNAFNLSIATTDGSTIEGTVQPLLMDEDGSWAEFVWVFALQDWRVFTPIVGGGWQSIVVDNSAGTYTSFDEQEIFTDTSSGAVTIDLPAAPTLGHRLRFIDHDGSWNTTNATVNGNGNNINGSATLVLDIADAWVEVVFNGVEWRVLNQ